TTRIFPIFLTIWSFVILSMPYVNAAEKAILVKDGVPASEIILGNRPTASAQLGAFELQYAVKRMTGAKLPILEQATKSKNFKIYIGDHPIAGIPAHNSLKDETIIRKFSGNQVALTGGDTSGYGKVDYNRWDTFPSSGLYEGYYFYPGIGYNGSLFAVYDFLEDLCGVRYFWHNDDFNIFPESKTLAVEKIDRRHKPPMDAFRNFNRADKKWKDNTARTYVLTRLRWRAVHVFGGTTHNSTSIYYKHWGKAAFEPLGKAFTVQRPEMFAKGYEGQGRRPSEVAQYYRHHKDVPPQVCFSSPEAVEYFAREAEIYYNGGNSIGGWGNSRGSLPVTKCIIPVTEGKPWFFPFESNDTSYFCKCEKCLKKITGDKNVLATLNASEAKMSFVSAVARRAAQLNPNIGISTLAYAQTFVYPDKVNFPENMSFELCVPVYQFWHPEVKRINEKEIQKWIDKSGKRPLTLWLYCYGSKHDAVYHHNNYKTFPTFYPRKAAEMVKGFVNQGFRGLVFECRYTHSLFRAYTIMRTAYDPEADTDTLLDDFFEKGFGRAGKYVKEFVRESEDAYWGQDICPEAWKKERGKYIVTGPPNRDPRPAFFCTGLLSPDIVWGKMGTDDRIARMDKLLKLADREVDTKFGRRIVDHLKRLWKEALEGQKEYKAGKYLTKQGRISRDNRQ
ncbi:MAG: DUF4838 domain-containing protein, partial [Lachnospiraceae bacterium]|nr:DUF4838 domain-containing protein [Lachnospiraceae bacterium]